MTTIRRLAAILAADVAGYSRLIGSDEAGTLGRLRAIRDDLINHPDRRADGSWYDSRTFPHCLHYCTAMACIILQMPNNYLPIFQR